jgi:hypothetical protein
MITHQPYFKPKHASCKTLKINQDFNISIYLFLAKFIYRILKISNFKLFYFLKKRSLPIYLRKCSTFIVGKTFKHYPVFIPQQEEENMKD